MQGRDAARRRRNARSRVSGRWADESGTERWERVADCAPRHAGICFLVLPRASPLCDEGPGKQRVPRGTPSKTLKSLLIFGAGEGIRTLDPNLGNPFGRFSLQQVLNRKTTKNPYTSITYVDTVFRVHTLESPWISVLLLPPCFPSHAAPARGSRFGGSRAPPP